MHELTYLCPSNSHQAEDFWQLYVHLRRPIEDRPTICDYHVFRAGIRPMWEDEANSNGGKWIVRLKKGVAARYWEDLVRSSHSRFQAFILTLLGHRTAKRTPSYSAVH